MLLVDTAKNVALDALFPTGTGTDRCYLGIHTDYHATGSNLRVNLPSLPACTAARKRSG